MTRDAVLAAGERLLQEQGGRLSMRGLAAALDATPAALDQHVPGGLTELLRTIATRVLDRCTEAAMQGAAMSAREDALGNALAAVHGVVAGNRRSRAWPPAIVGEYRECTKDGSASSTFWPIPRGSACRSAARNMVVPGHESPARRGGRATTPHRGRARSHHDRNCRRTPVGAAFKGGTMTPSQTNLGPRERRKRLLLGVVSLGSAVALVFAAVALEWPRAARLIVFIPLWMAALGLTQARESTCVALAARGTCNFDTGERLIEDGPVAAALRRRARRITRRATILAGTLTLIVLAFPR